MSKKQINICGSFGFGNAGDEAIPLAINDILSDLGISAEVNVLGRFARPDQLGVSGMGEEYADFRDRINEYPTLVSGGGVVENTNGSTIISCSKFLKKVPIKKLGLIGISADSGVKYGWLVKNRTRSVLDLVETIYTRDVVSESVVRKINPSLKVQTIGDLVLWMKPASRLPSNLPVLPSKFVAVVLAPRWSDCDGWRSWIVDELLAIQSTLRVGLVFVPMSCRHDDDRLEHKRVVQALRAKGASGEILDIQHELTPREISAILGSALITVSMRLHGCVMAYSNRVPFVSLAYHPKVSAFSKTVGNEKSVLPHCFPLAQSNGYYGYDFKSLNFSKGDLVNRVTSLLECFDFSKLEELRAKSKCAMEKFILESY